MRRMISLALLAAGLVRSLPADAASTSLTIIISSPNATGVSCIPQSPWTISGTTLTYPGASPIPVPSGSAICALVVTPTGWSGGVQLTGANASAFAIGGATPNYTLTVGSAALGAGTYAVNVTMTP